MRCLCFSRYFLIFYYFLLLVGRYWVPRYLSKVPGTAATSGLLYKPQMTDEDDFWSNWWNENWQGKPKYSEETYPSATLSTTKSHMTARSRTPDRSGGKPATNRLSYGAPLFSRYTDSNIWTFLYGLTSHCGPRPFHFSEFWNLICRPFGGVVGASLGLYQHMPSQRKTQIYVLALTNRCLTHDLIVWVVEGSNYGGQHFDQLGDIYKMWHVHLATGGY
jgi:hypothetical protein